MTRSEFWRLPIVETGGTGRGHNPHAFSGRDFRLTDVAGRVVREVVA